MWQGGIWDVLPMECHNSNQPNVGRGIWDALPFNPIKEGGVWGILPRTCYSSSQFKVGRKCKEHLLLKSGPGLHLLFTTFGTKSSGCMVIRPKSSHHLAGTRAHTTNKKIQAEKTQVASWIFWKRGDEPAYSAK